MAHGGPGRELPHLPWRTNAQAWIDPLLIMPPQAPSRPIVLATVGTDGDVYPFLELGLALRARGHRVTLATHEHFRRVAIKSGLGFVPLVSDAETQELLGQEHLWHALRGPMVIAKWGCRLMHRQFHLLKEAVAAPETHLIAHPGVVAARVVQEATQVSLTSIVLQPWMIPSTYAPPTMMGGLTLPKWSPHFVGRAYYRLFDRVGSALIGRDLARLRAPLGLPPIQRVFRWWFSPTLIIGLFPPWFGPPQPDWPPQLTLAGFPGTKGASPGPLPCDVDEFCRPDDPPVAFTFGTGMKHAAVLFNQCLEACRRNGRRGVFVTQYRDQLPPTLPSSALHCSFAPFARLFPRCAAVVHHGGIGTTAKALAAGCPQLILPFAFDQLDNAQRVHRLEMGTWLDRRNRSATTIAQALTMLTAHGIQERSRPALTNDPDGDGLARTCELLESGWKNP